MCGPCRGWLCGDHGDYAGVEEEILRMQMSEDGMREFAAKRKEEMMMKILGGVDAIMGYRRFS